VAMVVVVSRMIDHGHKAAARLQTSSLVSVTSLFVLVNIALVVRAATRG